MSRSDNARVNLGIVKSKLGEYEESDELQNQCLEYRRKEYAKVNDGDTGEITKALRNLGQNAMAWRKFEKAKQYFTKCIDELRKVPSEVIHRDNIAKFIGFNEHCVMVCDINIQIMSVQNHYLKRQDKIKRLRAISEESDLHLEVCLPSLMRLVDRGDRCYTKENLTAFLKFSNHNIMVIANLLIDRFEEYEYARELLLSIHSNDLDYLTKVHLCQMLEKIYYFYDDANRENLANYHAELEDEFSIEYPSFLDPSQEVVEKVEMRDTPFWQLDKYMTKLLIDLGVVDFHIQEGLHDSTFREILTDLFHSHDSKSILRLIHMGLAGQLWPYEDYTSGSDLLKARDTYSSDVMENVDVMWENAQLTLDDVTEFLTVIVGAMSNIKVASIASNSKMKYYMSRFSDATKVMEAWFSKDDDIKSIYNTLCKFVTRTNSVPKQLQFLCNIIDDISDIDVPAMQQRLFAIYAIIWSKSNARYTISLKKPGFHTHKDSVIKLAERLCIWIKQQPQTFELIASFSSDSKSLEGDSRIFMAKQLVELYESRIPQKWPFDVLQTRPKEMEGQQTKTIRNTEFKQEIEIAELERQSGSWSKSIERLKLVVDASKEAREYLFCADALNDLGTCYFEQERFDKAKEYYEEAMDLYCQIEDKEGEVDSLMNLALIANERKRFLDAEAKFDKCLDIYTALGQEVGVADVHINRADIRIEQEHYPEARENIQIALGILKTLNDKKWYLRWATALNVSADLYRKLDCFDEAINELEQAKSLSEEITDIKGLSDLYNNFGIAHMQYAKLLSLDGTPEAIKQFKKAEKYFRIHLETIAEIEERPNKWFEDNGFYTDSKIWPQFPPNDSPNWK
jgi:tetratricopeptide (TPR) repeat protein